MEKKDIMNIIINNRSDQPIYAQIEQQIRDQIIDGTLPEGTVLPSIRKLAAETGVSVITTTRAYSELVEQGFIGTIPAKGTIVLPQDNSLLREKYYLKIEENMDVAVKAAKRTGMTRDELIAVLDTFWEDEEEI